MKPLLTFLLALAALAVAAPAALSDVVRPPPSDCPPGYKARTGHRGPYCEPPLPKCAEGYRPRINRALAYCEPPPPKACPVGAFWTSTSATDVYCEGGRKCSEEGSCSPGSTCRKSSVCAREVETGRRLRWVMEIVSKACKKASDCPKGERCITASRCDLDTKVQPLKKAADPKPKK